MEMANPQEIPQMLTELYQMSKDYLRQETVEPFKRLGRHAGLGLGGASLMAFGVFLLAWGFYFGLRTVLPEGDWWRVLARFGTALVAAIAALVVAYRMQKTSEQGV